jgi:hypothetical protein
MPSQQRIDEVQRHMTGEVTHPTEGEVERRLWDEERTSVSHEEVLRLRGSSVERRRRAVDGLNFQHSNPQKSTNRSQYLRPKTSRIRDGCPPTTENLNGIARTTEKRVDMTQKRVDRTNSASNTTGRNPRAKEPMLSSSLGPVESDTTKLKPRKRLDQLEQESSIHNASRDVPLQRPDQSNTESRTRKLSIATTRAIQTQRPELAPIASESTPLRQQSSRLKVRVTSAKTRRPIAHPEPDPGFQVGNMNPSPGGVQESRNSKSSSETSAVKMNSGSTQINQPVCNIATQQSYAPQSTRNIAKIQRIPVKASGAKPGSRNVTSAAGAPIRPVVRSRAPQSATASQHLPLASAQPAILTPSSPQRIRMPRQNVLKGSPRTQTSHVRELTGPVSGRPHGPHIAQHKRHTNHIHPVAHVNQARHLHQTKHPHKTQHLHQPNHPYHARPKHCTGAETFQSVLHRESKEPSRSSKKTMLGVAVAGVVAGGVVGARA